MRLLLRLRLAVPVLAVVLLVASCGPDEVVSSQSEAGEDLPAATSLPVTERIELNTNVATEYYEVHGSSTGAIFDYIDRNGPAIENGERGSGRVASSKNYVWKTVEMGKECVIESMSITLNLVVTLPRHAEESSLTASLRGRWRAFAEGVATHEQRHVDVFLEGASTLRERMAAIGPMRTCGVLEGEIATVWAEQNQLTNEQQDDFHAEEDARIAAARIPLQAQIDANRARLTTLTGQIRGLDATAQALRDQIDDVSRQIAPIKEEMTAIESAYPSALPSSIYARYESLRTQHNALIARYNPLVQQHNDTLDRRNALATEHERLVTATNVVVEEYNWTR